MSSRIRAALILCSCLGASPVAAQPATPAASAGRVEVWFGPAIVAPRMSGQIATSFVPPLSGQTTTGEAGQVLRLDGGNTVGIEGGANVFAGRSIGMQVLVGYDRFDLDGRNDPYAMRLDYTSMQPPDYVPRQFTVQQSLAWPDTTGTVQQWTLAINGVARWTRGRRWAGSVSAGLAYFNVRGTARSLGYSEAFLGGHSVLFLSQYKMSFDLAPAGSVGFDAGGPVDLRLAGRLSLTADARYFAGANLEPPVIVRDIVNPDEVLRPSASDQIQRNLPPPAPSLSPARMRVMMGVKIRL
jgi:hypothetical protein